MKGKGLPLAGVIKRVTASNTSKTADGNFYVVIDKSFTPDEYGTYLIIFNARLSISSGTAIQENLDLVAYKSSSETTTALKSASLGADNDYISYGAVPMLVTIDNNCAYVCGKTRILVSGSSSGRYYSVTGLSLDFVKLY